MDIEYFQHPLRLPKNVPGPFYTTGHQCSKIDEPNAPLVWYGDCLACEAPEAEAPDLLSPLTNDDFDTYFVRQPATPEEIARACWAARVCCVSALRYGGKDIGIIQQLENNPEYCDYLVADDGELRQTVGDDGGFLPFAKAIVDARAAEFRRRQKKWWQFWK
jgi:hypothetical protein